MITQWYVDYAQIKQSVSIIRVLDRYTIRPPSRGIPRHKSTLA